VLSYGWRVEGHVGGHEAVTPPGVFVYGNFLVAVAARCHWCSLEPNDFASESEFGEGFYLHVSRDVEEFLVTLLVHFDAVSTTLKLCSEGADEFASVVEDKNGRMLLHVSSALVHDVEVLVSVNGDVVSDLPAILVRKLDVVVSDLILMLARADDVGSHGFTTETDVRESQRRSSQKGGLLQEMTTIYR